VPELRQWIPPFKGVEFAVYERGREGGLNWGRDHGSRLGLSRDDDFGVAPTVEKEVLLNFSLIDTVMQADRATRRAATTRLPGL
jgi:hypothetical protein